MPVIKQVDTYSGVVLEIEILRGKGWRGALTSVPRPPRERFADEEERKKHGEKMARKHHTQMVNANFEPGDLKLTLTFNSQNEMYYFDEARQLRDNYVRRLRYKYPDAVIFIYMGRGKTSGRIHFHALIKGVPVEYVLKQWRYGGNPDAVREPEEDEHTWILRRYGVKVDYLHKNRVINGEDHGPDYVEVANYFFDHWTPEQGGHRWKMTRNAKRPERFEEEPEDPKSLLRISELNPPAAPKGYKLVEGHSTAYGYLYFKYVLERPKRKKKGQIG